MNVNVNFNSSNSVTQNINAAEERENKLYAEAEEYAASQVKSRTLKCGNRYYWIQSVREGNSHIYTECQEQPTVEVTGDAYEPKELSEADRRNGVDPLPVAWLGTAEIRCGIARQKQRSNGSKGSPWKWFDSQSVTFRIGKEKGEWKPDFWQAGYLLRKLVRENWSNAKACEDVLWAMELAPQPAWSK